MRSRIALLISPYFSPSNLAGVQRVRVMSRGLKLYGWTPTVVTVDYKCYEEPVDLDSLRLLPEDLAIERVGAWPAKLCRTFGIGDISLRAQWALRRRVAKVIEAQRPSIIFATLLPGYTSLVGSWAKRYFRIPFVLDYQDPWFSKSAKSANKGSRWSKARVAQWLAGRVEARVLPHVDALTAVSSATLETLHTRDLIKPNVPIEVIPIGADRKDHEIAEKFGSSLIERTNGIFHIAYVGTLTDRMLPAFEAFLTATRLVLDQNSRKILVHLIGTSAQPAGNDRLNLAAIVRDAGLTDSVRLHPARVGYLDALRTMQQTDLLMLFGSTDPHYTASKLFPYWLSGKPILGLFHEASTIVELSRELGGVDLLLFNQRNSPGSRVADLSLALRNAIKGESIVLPRNESAFEAYSAEGVSSRFAALFDKVTKLCT